MKKRLFAMLLCACLIASFVLPVYAETNSITEVETGTQSSTLDTLTALLSGTKTEEAEETEAPSEETEAPSGEAEASTEGTESDEETETPAEETEETEATEEDELECTCDAAEGEAHAEDCPWYVPEPVTIPISVNYANVAPFLAPVSGPEVSTFSLWSARRSVGPTDPVGTDHDAIETSKVVADNGDGTYTITIESYVTGSTITSTEQVEVPTDIILILDQSGSMADSFGYTYTAVYESSLSTSSRNGYYVIVNGSYVQVTYCSSCRAWTTGCSGNRQHNAGTAYTPLTSATDTDDSHVQFYSRGNGVTKLSALQTAVTTFVNSVNDKAKGADGTYGTDDDVNHRIAVVGFAGCSTSSYNNTELFIGSNQYGYSSASNYYSTAFQDMNSETGYNNVIASKNALTADGSTYVDCGIDLANGIFNANPVEAGTQRNRIVVVFTDGAPGYNGTYQNSSYGKSGDAAAAADAALNKIATTKNTHSATVYTVGIFSGADATSAGSSSGNDAAARANYFMQNLSSNNGVVQTPSYYLSAADAGTLNNIFQQISNNIQSGGAGISMDSTTVLQDVVSEYFQIPEGGTVAAHTETYQGNDADGNMLWSSDGNSLTPSVSGSNVTINGFDYSANYVGMDDNNGVETPHGKKLVLEITVEPIDGFLGGNQVPTNGETSGLYLNGECMENLPYPRVDVPIAEITVSAADKNVYLLGSLTAEQMTEGAAATAAGNDLFSEDLGYKDDFVIIDTTDPEAVSNLTEDTTYTISVTISPVYGGEYGEETGSASGNVNVYKPVLTYKDSTVYYGEAIPEFEENNFVSTVWKHGDTVAANMIGTEPTLTKSYDKNAGTIAGKQDIPVNVTVKIGETEIDQYVTFAHQDCTAACGFDAATEEFLVHVKTCSLTVTKNGGEAGEPYVIHVYKDGQYYTELTLNAGGSTVIKELPVGTYTIEEDASWAWRYTVSVSNGVTLSSSNITDTVTCTNSNPTTPWLNAFSTVLKNVFGEGSND